MWLEVAEIFAPTRGATALKFRDLQRIGKCWCGIFSGDPHSLPDLTHAVLRGRARRAFCACSLHERY